MVARKLIVATGAHVEAFVPHFAGQEDFRARYSSETLSAEQRYSPDRKSVTVLGGSGFAWDAVCTCATAGVHVNWVIRCEYSVMEACLWIRCNHRRAASGHGPCWMLAPSYVTGSRNGSRNSQVSETDDLLSWRALEEFRPSLCPQRRPIRS